MIILNRKFKFLRRRIREKFLKFHLNGNVDRFETANTLGYRCRIDFGGHQNPVVQTFEAEVDGHRLTSVNVGNALSPAFREGLIKSHRALFTDAVRDIENADSERCSWVVFHPFRLPAIYVKSPEAMKRETAPGTYGETSPPSAAT